MAEHEGGPGSIPVHVGIIMDGNGRWAQARGLPRFEGHREGTENAKRIVRAASELGIRYLTLFVFSTENWRRAADEVGFLMGLIRAHLRNEFEFYRENKIRVLHSGDLEGLPKEVADQIRRTMADTAAFTGLTVNLAINYGGRAELLRAVRDLAQKLAAKAAGSASDQAIGEAEIAAALYQPEIPDPDLIIRTSPELRLSNFLLWQSAYAELYFSPKLWPDFSAADLGAAVEDYRGRDRRYGGRVCEGKPTMKDSKP